MYLIVSDDYLREGLISEIKIMQRLKSPNIVSLLDVMETVNNYYIVQEYCDGKDFDEYTGFNITIGISRNIRLYLKKML